MSKDGKILELAPGETHYGHPCPLVAGYSGYRVCDICKISIPYSAYKA
jgi:hypothetical protein